jgi:hypothetical protein
MNADVTDSFNFKISLLHSVKIKKAKAKEAE